MKILFLINTLPKDGGAEQLLKHIINNYGSKYPSNEISLGTIFGGGELIKELIIPKENIRIFGFSKRWYLNVSKIFKIIRFCKKEKFDIIHSHLDQANRINGILSFFLNSRHFITEHNINKYRHSFIGKLLLYFDSVLLRKGIKTICVSNEVFNYQKSYQGKFAGNLLLLQNAIDLAFTKGFVFEKNAYKTKLGLSTDIKYIVMVGRLVEAKAHDRFLNFAGDFFYRNSNVKLLIIGEGKLKEYLAKIIENKQLQESVFLLGFKNNVYEYLSVSELLVSSSVREGLPIAFIEAQAMGVPIVSTDVGGCSQIVIDNETGFLVKEDEFDTIYEKIELIINNKELRDKFSENARKKALENFDIESYIEKLHKIYLEK